LGNAVAVAGLVVAGQPDATGVGADMTSFCVPPQPDRAAAATNMMTTRLIEAAAP
jgi:hypothetical protein